MKQSASVGRCITILTTQSSMILYATLGRLYFALLSWLINWTQQPRNFCCIASPSLPLANSISWISIPLKMVMNGCVSFCQRGCWTPSARFHFPCSQTEKIICVLLKGDGRKKTSSTSRNFFVHCCLIPPLLTSRRFYQKKGSMMLFGPFDCEARDLH